MVIEEHNAFYDGLKTPVVFIWKIQVISNHFFKILIKNPGVVDVNEGFDLQPASINPWSSYVKRIASLILLLASQSAEG